MLGALLRAHRVLAVGIGGGGDVVGALALAELAGALGTEAVVGGLTWERRVVDPRPGPRRLDEIRGARVLNHAAAVAGPDTSGPGGFLFAESHMARHLGRPTLLLDINGGPDAVAAGLVGAAEELGCDLVALIDVGGDMLAHGDEPGLASPLADAICLAAAPAIAAAGPVVLAAVFGPGCDGELTAEEVLARVAEVARAGGHLGTWGPDPDMVARLEAAAREVPTEASAMALRCARGDTTTATIRSGRRTVQLTPVGGLLFGLDAPTALSTAARCAAAVTGTRSLQEANTALNERGIHTELDLETEADTSR